jgi:nucleotide-binding universal stress UspA family protein
VVIMYKKILVAVDGSEHSSLAIDAAISMAKTCNASITGCHVYAADLHRVRFVEMEPGLPEDYQEEGKLNELRGTHDEIIGDGMKVISDAYLAPLEKLANEANLPYEGSTPQGRNYVELLKLIQNGGYDLVVMGACGFGRSSRANIGSVAERVLLLAHSADVLLVRKPMPDTGPMLVGIDGSANSYSAMDRAAELASSFGLALKAASVYDPFFHLGVFGKITEALPEEQRAKFNFAAQEKLHDEIIDKGLEKIYRDGLDRALLMAKDAGISANGSVLTGKVFDGLLDFSASVLASLMVVGRWGIHKEEESPIGSNSLNIARLFEGNVLIASPRKDIAVPRMAGESAEKLAWTEDALDIINRVPPFARKMAKGAVEDRARKMGKSVVDAQTVNDVAALFGMGKKAAPSQGNGSSEAELVVLRKVKKLAPDFHKNILSSKILGMQVEVGQRLMVYEVVETMPEGKVLVGKKTRLEFR